MNKTERKPRTKKPLTLKEIDAAIIEEIKRDKALAQEANQTPKIATRRWYQFWKRG